MVAGADLRNPRQKIKYDAIILREYLYICLSLSAPYEYSFIMKY